MSLTIDSWSPTKAPLVDCFLVELNAAAPSALHQTHYYRFALCANMTPVCMLNSSLSTCRHHDTSLVSRSATLLPCRQKQDRAAVHCSAAYMILGCPLPGEKGMISTDQPDLRHACNLFQVWGGHVFLCFVLIDENVPVDPLLLKGQ